VVIDQLAPLLGAPIELRSLKHKPGRRHTLRAIGPRRTAIVKVYASDRAPVVAARVRSLNPGPPSPVLPQVLHVDAKRHMVVFSEVPGRPLRHALLAGDAASCRRAGEALGTWHRSWATAPPAVLRPHTAERELDALARWRPGERVMAQARAVADPGWDCPTVVHRDLYEEQVLVGPNGAVGLIDLDDVAVGPPELDLGNLVAHIELLGHRSGLSLAAGIGDLLDGYARSGPPVTASWPSDASSWPKCASPASIRTPRT
jgi:Ser/Thr protein kinase RdoA (MazF antagonist)